MTGSLGVCPVPSSAVCSNPLAMSNLRRFGTLRRLLDEHIDDVFEPSRALVGPTLAPRAGAPLQGVVR